MVEAAAGAVLWRTGAAGPDVAVIHRPKYDDWTFPKGKAEDGESPPLTAVREVWEETGVRPVLGRRLRSAEYVSHGAPKRVEYWAATGPAGAFTPGAEVDRLDWLPVPEAAERLTYPRDAALLKEFAGGPASTRPYLIVRHTSAGAKLDRDDELRPLDPRGRAEARRLGELLACFGPAQVVSSATARCLETMLPYASRVGVEIRTDRAFTVGTSDAAGARLAELLADAAPAIVCTHGELVPELVVRACKELDAPPPDDPVLDKGSFWVLQAANGTLASIERHALP
jgi:8-oxo-(d)GTP phosphatase